MAVLAAISPVILITHVNQMPKQQLQVDGYGQRKLLEQVKKLPSITAKSILMIKLNLKGADVMLVSSVG